MWFCRSIVSSKILFFVHFGKGRFYLTQYFPRISVLFKLVFVGSDRRTSIRSPWLPRVSVIEIMLLHFASAPIQAISV